MSIKCVSKKWSEVLDDYVREFVADTDDDFTNLPAAPTGSICLSVSSGTVKMVNAEGEWATFAEE